MYILKIFRSIISSLLCSLLAITTQGNTYNILDYGAIGNGQTKDTKAIQGAINKCSENGGGTVLVPSGKTYVIGTIFMKSNVTLHVQNGASLLGSPDIADYAPNTHKNMYKNEPHMDRCLIFADSAVSFAIEGYGTIDGNGHMKHFTRKTGRPMLMRFMNCKDVRINDIIIKNPAAWVSAWLYCDEIVVSGIRIHSRVNNNGDGLDFDGCTNVRVTNCSFNTSDDSICLQASRQHKPCKNITISNCNFESKWAGMRIGLLSRGDFESVTVTNCTFANIKDSGLKIQLNEGGTMQNMVFSNLVMKNVPRPIFMTFTQQRACTDAPEEMYPMKSMNNFIFDNIIVDNRELDKNSAILMTGMPEHYIENITLSNIQLHFAGGGTEEDASRTELPEYTLEVLKGWWPEFRLIGTLPAHGVYLRHMKNIYLNNIQIFVSEEDARSALFFDDVPNVRINQVLSNGELLDETEMVNQ